MWENNLVTTVKYYTSTAFKGEKSPYAIHTELKTPRRLPLDACTSGDLGSVRPFSLTAPDTLGCTPTPDRGKYLSFHFHIGILSRLWNRCRSRTTWGPGPARLGDEMKSISAALLHRSTHNFGPPTDYKTTLAIWFTFTPREFIKTYTSSLKLWTSVI